MNTKSAPDAELFPAYFPERLVQQAKVLQFRAGEALFSYKEPINALYRVLEGRFSLIHHTVHGGEIVLMRIGPEQFIAECSVCADIYTCHAQAEVDSFVARLSLADFDGWLYRDSGFARAWALDLARRLKDQFLRYERLSIRSARDRILHYLYTEARPDGVIRVPGSYLDLAAELGLQKETLYRTLASLEEEGLIARESHEIRIDHHSALM